MSKWLPYFYKIIMPIFIGLLVVSTFSLTIGISYHIYKCIICTSVLLFIVFLTCAFGLGYIIRYYALKNNGGY